MNLDILIGRTVQQILMEPGESCMHFIFDDGCIATFTTSGDCCSETWFADIVGVQALIGNQITVAEEIDNMPTVEDGRSRQEYDQFYGFKIFTAKGCCDFVYRNSSNGYYGGGCNLNVIGCTRITEDFSA